MAERLLITPEVRVAQLLAAYPELEPVLIGLSPSYQALKNPVLRGTVAKVATLRHVAVVGGVSLGVLINRLREAAGQEHYSDAGLGVGGAPAAPEWAVEERVTATLDARPILAEGGNPMQQVVAGLHALEPKGVYLLITPFVPAPLLDLAKGKGFDAYSKTCGPELVHTYFRPSLRSS